MSTYIIDNWRDNTVSITMGQLMSRQMPTAAFNATQASVPTHWPTWPARVLALTMDLTSMTPTIASLPHSYGTSLQWH